MTLKKTAVLLMSSLLASSQAWARPADPIRRLGVRADQPIVTLLVNGRPLRLKVDLGANGGVILNPGAAQRAELQQEGSTVTRIGPVRLQGNRALSRLALGEARWTSRVKWFDKNYVDDADGVISPFDLPFAEIAFEGLGQTIGKVFTLETKYTEERGVFVPVRVAGETMAVRFSLLQPQSFATGAAGALLAKRYDGKLDGDTIPIHIAWDVFRPSRRLTMAQPWTVGEFHFNSILVRLRDFRGNGTLPSSPKRIEPADIVVQGRTGERQAAEHFLTIGRDDLRQCESIVFSRLTKRLSFNC